VRRSERYSSWLIV